MCMSDYKWNVDLLSTLTHNSCSHLNYSAITNSHTLQITRAKCSQFVMVSTSRFLVTDLNNRDSSASVLTLLLSSKYPTTLDSCSNCHLGTDHIQNTVSNSSSICCEWIRCYGNMFVCEGVTQKGCLFAY
jgi:hypothetical protein